MHGLSLPAAPPTPAPAFTDPAGAREWLGQQPQTQPVAFLAALLAQTQALDGAALPPPLGRELLDLLRHAARPALASLESRFLRKPLPLPPPDRQSFTSCRALWSALAVAYLRLAHRAAPAERAPLLHRAASALRMAHFVHFQAAHAGSPQLDTLLRDILHLAEAARVTRLPIGDPEYPQFGEDSIGGHLAWTLLLRQVDPYALSAAQLAVANRAFSRWRDLASFRAQADADPQAPALDLAASLAAPWPEGTPRWLDVRKVMRKLRQRIEALEGGESPEALKLGRDLSAPACLRLLRQLESRLGENPPQGPLPLQEAGNIELVFGPENIYALIRQQWLNPDRGVDTRSATLAHQRLGLFGFDRISQLPNAVRTVSVPGEPWQQTPAGVRRPAGQSGLRLLSPCLIASRIEDQARLGVLHALHSDDQEQLTARVQWFDSPVEALPFTLDQKRFPAFLLRGPTPSLLVPASAALRPQQSLALGDTRQVRLLDVLERGADFVRYALEVAAHPLQGNSQRPR